MSEAMASQIFGGAHLCLQFLPTPPLTLLAVGANPDFYGRDTGKITCFSVSLDELSGRSGIWVVTSRSTAKRRTMAHTHLFFHGAIKQVRREIPPAAERWPAPKSETSATGGQLLPLIFALTKVPLDRYRLRAFERRVPACLRHLRVSTEEEACRKVFARPTLAFELLDVVLLGVSGFFRDAPVFDALERMVLPSLLSEHEKIRVWSPACSAGQELYSVAMLVDDLGALDRAAFLGTDCRGSAIARAEAGTYFRGEAANLESRAHQVNASKTGVEILPRLRERTSWKKADLLAGAEAGPWQLILWRNMAIYLDSAAAAALWHALFQQLAPGGYIVGGKADFPPADLPLVRRARCIFQKKLL